MNAAEADTLRPGDHVECYVRARVVSVHCLPTVKGRRAVMVNGPKGLVKWAVEDVERSRLDRTTANVFADWLEEQGEDHAAGLLRERFPLS